MALVRNRQTAVVAEVDDDTAKKIVAEWDIVSAESGEAAKRPRRPAAPKAE